MAFTDIANDVIKNRKRQYHFVDTYRYYQTCVVHFSFLKLFSFVGYHRDFNIHLAVKNKLKKNSEQAHITNNIYKTKIY